MDNDVVVEKLKARQVAVRILSVLICGVGLGACVFSLSLQIQEVGNVISSICWFSGLSAVVVSIAGYVVTCGPQYKNFVAPAVVAILAFGVCVFWLEHRYLWVQAVILLTLAGFALQLAVLVLYHVALKREDPQAL